jgi:hypothetical protein
MARVASRDIIASRPKRRTTRQSTFPGQSESGLSEIRIGALCWNQYTDWPSLLEAGVRADRLGYDTLWTWVH